VNIVAGGLIRDRRPQLDIYLRHLRTVRTPAGSRLSWLFVLDNCSEETTALVLGAFEWLHYVVVSGGGLAYDREKGHKHFDRMARIRNVFRQRAIAIGADALLSIDSDIVATPELLERLIEPGKPWVAALVDNTRGRRVAFNVMWEKTHYPGHYERRPVNFAAGGPADMVGAVCLYRRELLEVAEYQDDGRGEDVGFARSAAEARIGGWYIPLELQHLMVEGQVRAHLERCPLCVAGGPALLTAGGPTITEEGHPNGVHEPGTWTGADPVRTAGR